MGAPTSSLLSKNVLYKTEIKYPLKMPGMPLLTEKTSRKNLINKCELPLTANLLSILKQTFPSTPRSEA